MVQCMAAAGIRIARHAICREDFLKHLFQLLLIPHHGVAIIVQLSKH